MVIESKHIIYGPDRQPIVFLPRQRARYNGSDLVELRAGGYDWYVYITSTFDPYTQKLDGIKYIEGIYIIEGVISLTQAEKDQALSDLELVLVRQIDEYADTKRTVLLSHGSLVDQEYLMAYSDALDYKAADYTGAVPAGIQTWAEPKGWTAQVAADDILSTRSDWYDAGMAIRAIRLSGKEALRSVFTSTDKQAAFDATIVQFNALPF